MWTVAVVASDDAPMKVFSLDLSLTATGWCVAVDGAVKEYGLILGKYSDVARLVWNRNRVMDKVDAAKPDMVIFEGLAMRSMDGKALERTGMAYMIRAELFGDKIPWVECAPSSLKKFVVGRGGSKQNPVPKDLIVKYIATKFKHENVDDNNVCDAIGLAYVGMALLGDWTPTMKAQEEVLATIRKSQSVPVKTAEGW